MSRRMLVRGTIACLLAASALSVAGPPAGAGERLGVKLGPVATIVEGGQAVTIHVASRCGPESQVIQALVAVSQDGVNTEWEGVFSPTCDGHWHRHTVRVGAFEPATYHPGTARASAYLLVCQPSGNCPSAQDSRVVRIEPSTGE